MHYLQSSAFYRLISSAVLCLGIHSVSHASTNQSFVEDYQQAKALVNEYRELRFSCTSGSFEARKKCFRRLSEANEGYQKAKQLLANADPRYYLGSIAASSLEE